MYVVEPYYLYDDVKIIHADCPMYFVKSIYCGNASSSYVTDSSQSQEVDTVPTTEKCDDAKNAILEQQKSLYGRLIKIRCDAANRVRCVTLSTEIKKTPLHDFHLEHGAKMVPFAGFSMPVQYADQSLIESHLQTRTGVSIFDVSHMLQTKVYGKNRVDFMEALVPSDIRGLRPDYGTLTVLTNETGGIKDDLIVTKTLGDYLYVVTNAGCIDKDTAYFPGPGVKKLFNGENCSIDFSQLYFMTSTICTVLGIPDCRMTRCGYTGEDGVEISVDSARAIELCQKLLNAKEAVVKLAGLGARDSLRLEAGLCLYGNDIDESTTPVEANLSWIIAKRRRESADFPGAHIILNQLKDKTSVKRKRIGLISDKGRPPRSGCIIMDANGQEIGKVTSGCPSPSLKQNVAMAYCLSSFAASGSTLRVNTSPTSNKATFVNVKITKMPFLPSHYYSKPKDQ